MLSQSWALTEEKIGRKGWKMSDTPTFSVYVRGEDPATGEIVGEGWVDLDGFDSLEDFVGEALRTAGYAENPYIVDYEYDYGFDLPEGVSLGDLWDLYQAFQSIDADRREAFADYLALVGGVEYLGYALMRFEDAYEGRYESLEAFAWEYARDVYPQLFQIPPGFQVEVDLTVWEMDFCISDNGHVFSKI